MRVGMRIGRNSHTLELRGARRINKMLPCHATGQGSTMAAAGPGPGHVALGAKPGAQVRKSLLS